MTQTAFCQMNVPEICMTQSSGKHHRQRRSEGNDDPVNLLEACPACHEWVHKHPEHARLLGWIVPTWANPETVPILGWMPTEALSGDSLDVTSDGLRSEGTSSETKSLGQPGESPESACPKCKGTGTVPDEPKPEKLEKARTRSTWSMRVPKDDQENGADLMDDIVSILRPKMAPDFGWSEKVPAYTVVRTGLGILVLHYDELMGDS